jgi:arabinofuranan 3-O-arabinosyltransferase
MARYLGVDEVLARNDVVGETTGGGPPAALAAALAAQPSLRLAASYGRPGEQVAAPPGDAALALDDGARVVLTDSNRRRTWATRRTGASYSPTLAADQPVDPGSPALSLFGDPSAQTVVALSGAGPVTATSSGSVFGPVPYGKPTFAFDADPRTAWVTGDFGAGVGQSVSLRLARPRTLSRLVLRPLLGSPVQVAAVRIRMDGRTVTAAVPARPVVEVALPPTTTASLTVEISAVRGGPGLNPVGFWEIGVPGVRVAETAVLPGRFRRLVEGLDAAGRRRLASAPLDVVLARAAGPTRGLDDDEERALDRRFWLPGVRAFDLSGLAAPGPDLGEPQLDRLLGASPEVTARSSSRAFDGVGVRASQAFDGNRDTAWIPGGRGPGEWVEASFPARRLDHVVVRQDVPRGLKGVDAATAAELSLDGGRPVRARLRQGATRIRFPARTVRRLRLTITDVVGLGGQVRISEVQAGRVRVDAANRPEARLRGCVTLAELDGVPVRARLQGTLDQLAKGRPLRFEACGGPLRLGPGDHHLRSAPGWLVDLLHLASGRGRAGPDPPPAPRVTVTSSGAARTELAAEPAAAPWYLVAGQGYDRRWRATMDGQPLGPPELLDGWSIGWRVSDPRPHRFAVEFGPQRPATASLAATLAALAVVAALLVRGRWWR